MIQRIQSVYLFMTTLLSLLFLNGDILNFINKAGGTIKVTFKGIEEGTASHGFSMVETLLPLSIVLIIIPLLSLIAIFLFRQRKIQIRLSGILIGLICFLIIACVHSSYLIITKHSGMIVPGIKMAIPVVMLIFAILAYRGIKKDEELVKSYDRLR